MKRVLLLVLGCALLATPLLISSVREKMRGVMMLTTADPDVLGIAASSSMEPVTVTLHTRRPARSEDALPAAQGSERRIIERKLSLTAPAAYFSVLDLKDGPTGPQRVGFSVWSGDFDPFQPDSIRDRQDFVARRSRGETKMAWTPENSVVERRKQATGEYELSFEVMNGVRPALGDRQRVLRGLVEPYPDRPCVRQYLPDLGLERLSVPDGVEPGDSCLGAPPTERHRHNYRRVNANGSIEFVAICDASGAMRGGATVARHPRCRLHGYFGLWPLYASVKSVSRSASFRLTNGSLASSRP